jgi:hypothetical protein
MSSKSQRWDACVRRREFITVLGAAATWPLAVRAQQSAMPVIGFFHGNKPRGDSGAVDGIRAGLRDAGFIEGKNFVFEYRWAEKHFDRNPALASDLVNGKPAVIIVGGAPLQGWRQRPPPQQFLLCSLSDLIPWSSALPRAFPTRAATSQA